MVYGSDVVWRHRSGSTLAQEMTCCLTAPSHYLNQCWLFTNISEVLYMWNSPENNFSASARATTLENEFKIMISTVWNYCHITQWVNTLIPRQSGRHFPDDIFKWIFLNENVWISIEFSLKCVPKGPINRMPPLFQIMAWCPMLE